MRKVKALLVPLLLIGLLPLAGSASSKPVNCPKVAPKPLKFGNLSVPAGTYTLWVVPAEKQWELVVSKATGQWGTQYKEGQDLGRVPMTVGKAKIESEQLTWAIDDTPKGGTLRLDWGTSSASVPFTVG